MKKAVSILMIMMLVLGLLAGCSSSGTATGAAAESEVIKIGWIGSLTGDQAIWGTCEFNTVQMMVEDANANGGWLGKQIEVIGYDTKGDSLEAVNAVKRLVGQDKVVAIIGPNASGQAIAISQVLEEAGVPDIATVATNPKVTVDENGNTKPYNFRVCFIDPYQGAVAAGYAYEVLGLKKAAILYDVADEYSQGLTEFFEKTFVELGGEIVAKEAFKFGDVDFRPQLSSIKEINPEMIFMPYFFKEVALSSTQARELGINAVLMGGDGWTSEQLLEMAGDSVQGSYVVNHLDFEDPDVQTFKNAYMAKYNAAVELNGYLAYDAFRLLEESVKKAGVADSVKIKEAMETAEVQGITGKIKINPKTHNPEGKEAAILKIDQNKYVFQTKYSVEIK
ncbi:ABC transporter substrate-binding protein [Fusibacter sp. 3D3]|uniref:ABC transporter substrate-binding protein n=1 Tax=Fusibacter sp. 3D3 TaxID=1048380 RepID=UPI000853A8AF|nr:ABC transporter substrate-binding protein [Fusibacter sp. 3D3]GAU79167.1 branched-chain amino acid ABC transporter [Fusibacter sp. 3D3]